MNLSKRSLLPALFVLTLSLAALAQTSTHSTAEPESTFNVGGTSIVIPSPDGSMVEAGGDRPILENFTPQSNRLIAVFVKRSDMPLHEMSADHELTLYGMVQVLRRAEFMDIDENGFKEVTASAKESLGGNLASFSDKADAELAERLKNLDVELNVTVGKPVIIGTFLSQKNAYAFGMIVPVKKDGETIKMITGCTLMRVKNRLIYLYVYVRYQNEESVHQMHRMLLGWTRAILAENQ
jgi:hypothetical protein